MIKNIDPRSLMILKTVLTLSIALAFIHTNANAQEKKYLVNDYKQYCLKAGSKNTDKLKIASGPTTVALKRGQSPGKTWLVSLGKTDFRISIEDQSKANLADIAAKLERLPPLYRRAFAIVSEPGKDGVAIYKNLNGAAAHGSQNYLNIIPQAGPAVYMHEAGHVMEQRARNQQANILEQWTSALKADQVSVSRYGDGVAHEDLAEFAMLYAGCLNAGKLDQLKRDSPKRYELWEKILKLADAK